MRREEALLKIQSAKYYTTVLNPIWDEKEIGEARHAFDMAIEALSEKAETNLDHLHTMSAKEIGYWFYMKWLEREQYVWNSSMLGLIETLNRPYDEKLWRL